MTLLVTGAAGFIGSCYVRMALDKGHKVIMLDKLTYAGRMENIQELIANENFIFIKGDICDYQLVEGLFDKYKPHGLVHFAAESHVDNSINGPKEFLRTNVEGTFNLLEVSRHHFKKLNNGFKFVHVSTDEVFGELGAEGKFSEETPYDPSSPYSATKAASDHLVRAWHRTYGLPAVVTNCSNNYGPRQFPEKLIPRVVLRALAGMTLPVYGKGNNVRDWIHVEDHCAGVHLALEQGLAGDTYCFGGNSERQNIEVVKSICGLLDKLSPRKGGKSYQEQITFVEDRAGHDFRYAIDDSYAQKKLNFKRKYSNFETGLEATVKWYLENQKFYGEVKI
jgi:dTDP-glucose 4,6-dehydratase